MNLIEQLNDLCTEYEGGALALSVVTDLRAIIEQAKREAVEPIAVPEATQQDHTKLIEQLLAVIELQRNAMQEAVDCGMVPTSSAKEGGAARHSQYVIVADKIRSALALQPADVELVEVGRWVDEGNSDESDFYPVSYCGREGSGDMCYTIKTKADTK